MPDDYPLTLADRHEVLFGVTYALTHDMSGKPTGQKARTNIPYVAKCVVEHLERSGYVVMRKVIPDPTHQGVGAPRKAP